MSNSLHKTNWQLSCECCSTTEIETYWIDVQRLKHIG